MFFRSFCGKLHFWSSSRAPNCLSKLTSFSTSSSVQAKTAKKPKIPVILEKSKETQLEVESSEKNEQKTLEKETRESLELDKSPTINLKLVQNEKTKSSSSEKPGSGIRMNLSNHKRQTSVPTSVLTSSNVSVDTDKKIFIDLVPEAIQRLVNTNTDNWEQVRRFVLEHEKNRGKYTIYNLDSNIIGYCMSIQRFDLASNYFKYLSKQKVKPNLATLAKYLKVLYFKNMEKCSIEDEIEILTLYEEISKEYPILEPNSLNSLVLALSITKEWRKTLEIMEDIKKLLTPSKAAYSAVVSAMFSNKQDTAAWSLLEEMLQNNKLPDSVAFLSHLKSIKRLRKSKTKAEKLENLFEFFKKSEMICPEDVSNLILEICQKEFFGSANTRVTLNGHCQNCRQILENSELSEIEFQQLKEKFMKNVILGKDLFLKSDPSELSKFKEFIENMEKFDVVLDGLNIAYSTGDRNPQVQAKLLTCVVKHYIENNKSVLLLGRVHMKTWSKASWKYIVENTSVFLTKNISQDDPYLLYCALNSGRDTIVVTRDLMRSHKFLLKDIKFKRLFQKWLDQRQHILLTVGKNSQPIFKKPPDFSPIAQQINGIWHVPYESSVKDINEHFHKTWLCINLKV